MRYVLASLMETVAAWLMAISPPSFAKQVIVGPNGHYYKLFPLRRHLQAMAPEACIPTQTTDNVVNTSNCRLIPRLAD